MIIFIHYKKCLFWGITILWMALIFYFSSMPAQASKHQDNKFTRPYFHVIYPDGIKQDKGVPLEKHWQYSKIRNQVRKFAHVILYFVLGMLVGISIKKKIVFDKNELVISLAICIVYAIFDEVHQFFVPGRAMMLFDILLDSLSSTISLLILCLINDMIQKKKGKCV